MVCHKERLEEAKRSLKRLDSCIHSLIHIKPGASLYPGLDQLLYDLKHGFKTAMDDDLNMSAAMASIFNNVKRLNKLILENRLDPEGASKIVDAFRGIDSVLKIFDFKDDIHDPGVQRLIEQRDQARQEKNWDLADRIRDQLTARGINVKDHKIS